MVEIYDREDRLNLKLTVDGTRIHRGCDRQQNGARARRESPAGHSSDYAALCELGIPAIYSYYCRRTKRTSNDKRVDIGQGLACQSSFEYTIPHTLELQLVCAGQGRGCLYSNQLHSQALQTAQCLCYCQITSNISPSRLCPSIPSPLPLQ